MKIHFIGIGGIGLSGLARFLHFEGYEISGSDVNNTPITKSLENLGIKVYTPQKKENIKDIDLVIYSAAIKKDNPELIEAKRKGIKTISRREALPLILRGKKVYAVAGAHGKSTTSAILASILKDANAIIGAESKDFKSNVRFNPKSDILVFEADESDASFLNSNPYCAIVTNAEPEHMEFYNHDLDLFYQTYKDFLKLAKIRILNEDDPFLKNVDLESIKLNPKKDIKIKEYFLKDDEPHIRFELRDFGEFEVWGFGPHIALDASLAILAAMNEIGLDEIKENIKNYRGIKKRFDIVKKEKNLIVIDDYGHHPTEIEATMKSLKEYAKLKGIDEITIIWQPHKYSRTIDNLDRFIECFGENINLVILPVWSAGEDKIDIDFEKHFKRYSPIFADFLKMKENKIILFKNEKDLKSIEKGLIVGFGAGDITYQLRGMK
ncbi:UDP-N-acetylmuramate--L-alanine ligase [Nitrosophilus kaiyonis]|uniref:UDP-N-acetylmuramate--L-alanine ligase n=1 Tax=Nitrosophilus kaiyonis TaxID=2930200 RepID=UPI0024937B8A|nr:UDP-N-acetylmuramate--L-alanine ligase [Nitrosophilus kaiyonis]